MIGAAIYLRVSQDSQTVENQRLVLAEVAERPGWSVGATFEDQGISGATGRDRRPGYDALLKAAARREVDMRRPGAWNAWADPCPIWWPSEVLAVGSTSTSTSRPSTPPRLRGG